MTTAVHFRNFYDFIYTPYAEKCPHLFPPIDEKSASFLLDQCLTYKECEADAKFSWWLNATDTLDDIKRKWTITSPDTSAKDMLSVLMYRLFPNRAAASLSDIGAAASSSSAFRVATSSSYAGAAASSFNAAGVAASLFNAAAVEPSSSGIWIPKKVAAWVTGDASITVAPVEIECSSPIDVDLVKILCSNSTNITMAPLYRFTTRELDGCSENFRGVKLENNLPVPILDFTVPVAVCKRAVFVTFSEDARTLVAYGDAYRQFASMTDDDVLKAYVPDYLQPHQIRLMARGMRCPSTMPIGGNGRLDVCDFGNCHGAIVFELSMESAEKYLEIFHAFDDQLTDCESRARKKRKLCGIEVSVRYFTIQHCTIPTSSERLRIQSKYHILPYL